ncbi:uncharacterized protein Pyn_17987 [Prunus yedoensis var. nudiflora]|uniref:GRF-type domain-containing protein n=1 Tax=Prunus yedoensis var. nudiflora TaxID=2094558 RepID=A0A314UNK6_PRUYE|nr:uncharacterized protein Pyn_17987 [Prunus yedoensis var. nudiflora]
MRPGPPFGEEAHVVAPCCCCGKVAQLQTLWTKSNPMTRFHACPKSGGRNNGCRFFCWVDDEMPPHEKGVMAWLLRRMRQLEQDIERMRAREKKLWVALFILWVVVVFV